MAHPLITSYASAEAFLSRGRYPETRTYSNNVTILRRGESISARVHRTDVVTFHPDGTVVLSTGGWHTQLTRRWIERFTPSHVTLSLRKGEIFIGSLRQPEMGRLPLYDGLSIVRGTIRYTRPVEVTPGLVAGLRERAREYAKQVTRRVLAGVRETCSDCASGLRWEHVLAHAGKGEYPYSLVEGALRERHGPEAKAQARAAIITSQLTEDSDGLLRVLVRQLYTVLPPVGETYYPAPSTLCPLS